MKQEVHACILFERRESVLLETIAESFVLLFGCHVVSPTGFRMICSIALIKSMETIEQIRLLVRPRIG